jgi:hypothetical protein
MPGGVKSRRNWRAPVRAGGEKVKMIQAVVVLLPGHAKILHRLALRAIADVKVQRLRHPHRP